MSKATGRCLDTISRQHNLLSTPHSLPRHAHARRIHATPLSQAAFKKSSAQIRSSAKNAQLERQKEQQQAITEKYKDDPAGAARHMDRMTRLANRAGQDIWTNAKMAAIITAIPNEKASLWDRAREFKNITDPENTTGVVQNWVKNAASMFHMSQEVAFPAQYSYPSRPYTALSETSEEIPPPPSTCPAHTKPWVYSPKTWYELVRYDAASKRFPPWSSGIKGIGMSLYLEMCEAVGKGDIGVLKRVCSDKRLADLLEVVEKRDRRTVYNWRVDSVAPCKIVSLRAGQAYAGYDLPRGRHRLLINALIKFDTTQSAQVITAGKPAPWTSKRIVEYMIIEKRGWTSAPWTIREKLT